MHRFPNNLILRSQYRYYILCGSRKNGSGCRYYDQIGILRCKFITVWQPYRCFSDKRWILLVCDVPILYPRVHRGDTRRRRVCDIRRDVSRFNLTWILCVVLPTLNFSFVDRRKPEYHYASNALFETVPTPYHTITEPKMHVFCYTTYLISLTKVFENKLTYIYRNLHRALSFVLIEIIKFCFLWASQGKASFADNSLLSRSVILKKSKKLSSLFYHFCAIRK